MGLILTFVSWDTFQSASKNVGHLWTNPILMVCWHSMRSASVLPLCTGCCRLNSRPAAGRMLLVEVWGLGWDRCGSGWDRWGRGWVVAAPASAKSQLSPSLAWTHMDKASFLSPHTDGHDFLWGADASSLAVPTSDVVKVP